MTSLVFGAIDGLIIALLAIGLVLVYRAGRFVNFAHGQLGVLSAMLLAKAALDWDLPWLVAFPVAVAVGALVGAICERLLIRRLRRRSRFSLLIATVGLSEILLALTYFDWIGPNRFDLIAEGYPVPFDVSIPVGALQLRGQHVLVIVVGTLTIAALTLLLNRSRFGRMIRAAASNPDAASLAGLSVSRISTSVWALAGGLSAISAILSAPGQASFDSQVLGPALLLRALGAAAIAGFTSLPLAVAGGIGLGVLEAATLRLTHQSALADLMILLTIVGGLVIQGRRVNASIDDARDVLSEPTRPIVTPPSVTSRLLVRHGRLAIGLVTLVGLALLPLSPFFEAEDKRFVLALVAVFAVVAMSLTVLTGWSGQVSLGQFALVGVGAFIGARTMNGGATLSAALLLAGMIGALFAVAIGAPALRLRGLTLAVTTLGFAVVGPSWLFRQSWFAGSTVETVPTVDTGFGQLNSQLSIYYATLAAAVLVGLALSRFRRTSPGRLMVAVRDNPAAASSFGVSSTSVRVIGFALSGAIASSAGVLWLTVWRTVGVELVPPQQSLIVLSIPIIGGMSSLPGAALGSAFVIGMPLLVGDAMKSVFSNTIQFQLAMGGIGLIITQIRYPDGIAGAGRRVWQWYLDRLAAATARSGTVVADEPTSAALALDVQGVVVEFGGVRALDEASMVVHEREIVALIGANGAGKTTLLNAISGRVTPSAGSIRVLGRELVGLGADFRAHFGVARSFQDARLFPDLTVRETIQVACARHHRVGVLASLLGAPWVRSAERRAREQADDIIDRLGLGAWADTSTRSLSTGTRRICDLGCQIAAAPRLLLLDEPTAGVAQREAEAFVPLLRRIVDELECAVLIIEHDLPLVLGLADRVYCFQAGRVLAEGSPHEIRSDPRVIASYLGSDQITIERSGSRSTSRRQARARPLVGGSQQGS